MMNEKPEVLGHPDDAAEEWLAEEFEEDHSTDFGTSSRPRLSNVIRPH